jgi:hypothetical protein
MSQTGTKPARSVNAHGNPKPALGWEVFVTPGIPVVTPDRSPGVRVSRMGYRKLALCGKANLDADKR